MNIAIQYNDSINTIQIPLSHITLYKLQSIIKSTLKIHPHFLLTHNNRILTRNDQIQLENDDLIILQEIPIRRKENYNKILTFLQQAPNQITQKTKKQVKKVLKMDIQNKQGVSETKYLKIINFYKIAFKQIKTKTKQINFKQRMDILNKKKAKVNQRQQSLALIKNFYLNVPNSIKKQCSKSSSTFFQKQTTLKKQIGMTKKRINKQKIHLLFYFMKKVGTLILDKTISDTQHMIKTIKIQNKKVIKERKENQQSQNRQKVVNFYRGSLKKVNNQTRKSFQNLKSNMLQYNKRLQKRKQKEFYANTLLFYWNGFYTISNQSKVDYNKFKTKIKIQSKKKQNKKNRKLIKEFYQKQNVSIYNESALKIQNLIKRFKDKKKRVNTKKYQQRIIYFNSNTLESIEKQDKIKITVFKQKFYYLKNKSIKKLQIAKQNEKQALEFKKIKKFASNLQDIVKTQNDVKVQLFIQKIKKKQKESLRQQKIQFWLSFYKNSFEQIKNRNQKYILFKKKFHSLMQIKKQEIEESNKRKIQTNQQIQSQDMREQLQESQIINSNQDIEKNQDSYQNQVQESLVVYNAKQTEQIQQDQQLKEKKSISEVVISQEKEIVQENQYIKEKQDQGQDTQEIQKNLDYYQIQSYSEQNEDIQEDQEILKEQEKDEKYNSNLNNNDQDEQVFEGEATQQKIKKEKVEKSFVSQDDQYYEQNYESQEIPIEEENTYKQQAYKNEKIEKIESQQSYQNKEQVYEEGKSDTQQNSAQQLKIEQVEFQSHEQIYQTQEAKLKESNNKSAQQSCKSNQKSEKEEIENQQFNQSYLEVSSKVNKYKQYQVEQNENEKIEETSLNKNAEVYESEKSNQQYQSHQQSEIVKIDNIKKKDYQQIEEKSQNQEQQINESYRKDQYDQSIQYSEDENINLQQNSQTEQEFTHNRDNNNENNQKKETKQEIKNNKIFYKQVYIKKSMNKEQSTYNPQIQYMKTESDSYVTQSQKQISVQKNQYQRQTNIRPLSYKKLTVHDNFKIGQNIRRQSNSMSINGSWVKPQISVDNRSTNSKYIASYNEQRPISNQKYLTPQTPQKKEYITVDNDINNQNSKRYFMNYSDLMQGDNKSLIEKNFKFKQLKFQSVEKIKKSSKSPLLPSFTYLKNSQGNSIQSTFQNSQGQSQERKTRLQQNFLQNSEVFQNKQQYRRNYYNPSAIFNKKYSHPSRNILSREETSRDKNINQQKNVQSHSKNKDQMSQNNRTIINSLSINQNGSYKVQNLIDSQLQYSQLNSQQYSIRIQRPFSYRHKILKQKK